MREVKNEVPNYAVTSFNIVNNGQVEPFNLTLFKVKEEWINGIREKLVLAYVNKDNQYMDYGIYIGGVTGLGINPASMKQVPENAEFVTQNVDEIIAITKNLNKG